MIMVVESHLQIDTGKLSEVTMSVRIFSPKDRTNFEDALHVGGDAHLLGELRALGEEGGATEVVYFEDLRAGMSI